MRLIALTVVATLCILTLSGCSAAKTSCQDPRPNACPSNQPSSDPAPRALPEEDVNYDEFE
ncbi:MAG: hypothetical protein A2341_01940 [Deltaproteobacteria bacterium RIFOXYB12_FULL_58_9]|nr:MAG: hypothetical protein A2341_01940 [Deltaproteobacteria bacterium RIFOXYB12_FULL_58_9]